MAGYKEHPPQREWKEFAKHADEIFTKCKE